MLVVTGHLTRTRVVIVVSGWHSMLWCGDAVTYYRVTAVRVMHLQAVVSVQ